MKKFFKSKLFIVSFLFMLLGMVFLYIQKNFYGYVDSDGFVHDSIFLPFGVFSIMIGSILLGIHLVIHSIKIARLHLSKVN